MILSFKTNIKGKPTFFVNKIWAGLIDKKIATNYDDFFNESPEMQSVGYTAGLSFTPKIHTIREDKKNLWKNGMMIHFFINARQPNMFQFAPSINLVSMQDIEIKYVSIYDSGGRFAKPFVKIDGVIIYDVAGNGSDEMLKLARNDGFNGIHEFFSYFNKDFKGKILHWTDFKYQSCLIECESCGKETDIETMTQDDDSNWFCPKCWVVLSPVMKAEYEKLKQNGEID